MHVRISLNLKSTKNNSLLAHQLPVYLLIKRLVPFGSSRFCLHHPLPLPRLRKGRVQAPQQAELCFCHTVVFHAILTVFLKIHVALQLIDGFIIQPQRFLQSLLTVTVGILRDALIVVQISQELTGSAQRIRPSQPPARRRRSGAHRPVARCPPRLRQNRCNPPRRGNPYHGSAPRCKAP